MFTAHLEEYEKDNITRKGIDEPEIRLCCNDYIQEYVKEPSDMKQVYQIEGTQQEHDDEEISIGVIPADLAKGNEFKGYDFFKKIKDFKQSLKSFIKPLKIFQMLAVKLGKRQVMQAPK